MGHEPCGWNQAVNLARQLLRALRLHGAREIFGIPGDFVLDFFREAETSGILPLYTLSHEPGIAYAADGAARASMRLGVVAATYGAGALNLVNAVAGAYAEKSPLVVISGAPGREERSTGLLLHHQARSVDSQLAIFREVTCRQTVLNDSATAPAEIARVLRSCLDRSRPVYIELPRDLARVPCGPVVPLAAPAVNDEGVAAAAGEVLAALRAAQRPAVLVGVEVRRFGIEPQVAELIRRLDIPAYGTLMSHGVMADAEGLLAGTYLGGAGDPAVAAAVEGSDALLLLGVIVSDTNFGISGKRVDLRRAIRVADREVRIRHHVYPDAPLPALVESLLEQLPPKRAKAPLPPVRSVADTPADDRPLVPDDAAPAVNRLAAKHGRMPIVSDVGDCLFASLEMEHAGLLAPGYYAGMGFGVPAGIGVQIASGRRPLILVGDGAFEMTGWELGNCPRYRLDPIVLLFNNRSWGMLRAFEPQAGFVDRGDWNFAAMAAGMGGEGCRVSTPRELRSALEAACGRRGRVQLIELLLQPYAVSAALSRFGAGMKRPER